MKSFIRIWILCLCVMGCSEKGPEVQDDADADVESEVIDEDVGEDVGFEPELPEPPAKPVLTPCPEGWVEVPPEDEDGVTTCDPWPDVDLVTLPVLTPCPEGWREVPVTESGDVMGCDPYPEGGPHECASDEAHFLGEPGCSKIGTACPEGNWAEDLPPDSEVLYVLADAPPGGDGTQESPFGTIDKAMDAAVEGTIIALSKGIFNKEVFLLTGVTLWGACVAETLVTCTEQSETEGTIMVRGRDTEVRNLRVSGNRMGIQVRGSRSVHIEDVLIESAQIYGLYVWNAGLATARSIVVRDTRSRESDRTFGRGMQVSERAQVEVTRALFVRNRDVGIIADQTGTILNLNDVVIRDTQPRESDRMFGSGLEVLEGAQVDVNRVLVERNRDTGILADHTGTILNIIDSVIRDTQSRERDRMFGRGLNVQDGAQVEVTRTLIARNRNAGIVADLAGTVLKITDCVISDTQSQEIDGTFGRGLAVQNGAQVEVNRALFERNRDVGIAAHHTGSILSINDAIIRDTQPWESNGMFGQGMQVIEGAQAEVNRALFERNHNVGIIADDPGTILNLTDIIIRDTQSQENDKMFGVGMQVSDGAQVEANRSLFERNRSVGIFAARAGTILNLTDIVIRDTRPQEIDGMFGQGLDVLEGPQVDVTRALIEGNRGTGIVAGGVGAMLSLTDAIIRDTRSLEGNGKSGSGMHIQKGAQVDVNRALVDQNRDVGILAADTDTVLMISDVVVTKTMERECVHTTCSGLGGGMGIISLAGALLEMERFVVSKSALCGLQLAHGVDELGHSSPVGGIMDLHNGVVSQNPIGVNIQTEGFDIYRLMDEVLYIDNETNLDTSELPVPEAGIESLEPLEP